MEKDIRYIIGKLFLMILGFMPSMPAFAQITSWNQLYEAMQAGGEIQLTQNITYSGSKGRLMVPSGKTVTLDLNGYAINRNLSSETNKGSVIQVNGTLIINDSKGSGKIKGGFVKREKNAYDGGGGLFIDNGGHVTLNGGSICENKAKKGAGVIIEPGGFLTVNGGSISNNTNSGNDNGGAVYIHASTEVGGLGGTMIMNGGVISGNVAGAGAGVYIDGENSAASVFTMNGGVIKDNIAQGYHGGGGIMVCDNSTFNMTGGIITHNTTKENYQASGEGGYGGGIRMEGGATCHVNITIDDDTQLGIYENSAHFGGDDISKSDGTVINLIAANRMVRENGAIFSENANWITDNNGHRARSGQGSTYTQTGTITSGLNLSCSVPCLWCDLQNQINAASSGDVITLSYDVTATTSGHYHYSTMKDADIHLVIPEGKSITIDLNGHTIDRNLSDGAAAEYGDVFTVNGSLTIKDSSSGQTGTVTGGNNTSDGGAASVNGQFVLEGGIITGNSCVGAGGGLYIHEGAGAEIKGGAISANTAGLDGNGVFQSGTMLLSGSPVFGADQYVYLPAVENPTESTRSTYVITKAGEIGDIVIPVKVANEVSGRDILVSKKGATAAQDVMVIEDDSAKLSVLSNALLVVFNAEGRDGGAEPEAVIEFAGKSTLTVRRLDLKAGESAVYSIFKDGSSTPLLMIALTGTSGSEASRTIVGLTPGQYTVREDSWSWTYGKNIPAVAPVSQMVSVDTGVGTGCVESDGALTFTFSGEDNTDAKKHSEDVKNNSLTP